MGHQPHRSPRQQWLKLTLSFVPTHHDGREAFPPVSNLPSETIIVSRRLIGGMLMARPKKELGRPVENKLPPRIDATPEKIAEAFFRF